ncbi:anti-CBASS protein Acb1 family protein [Pseudodonghicola flavimaris]|uniref:DUF1073 domain-containing protein n=1 Tax=Pseudodonghicola flavimaris TaxID=3050036 RepID=A0ABT7EW13_9RHOB|nr:anti-CBASS Acb1 family protein [Pseudodonghicola flavimaris]MDK3016539.1 DUF1073 domain-containing protein [Pseudodonghicola flavimaris]
MTLRQMVANVVQRTLGDMFPAYFQTSAKHDHFKDFGWPDQLTFAQFYRMYRRNGLATAGVDKTIAKTWEDNPELWESETPAESPLEGDIRKAFERLRLWHRFATADTRSMVGCYAGVILRLRDGLPFDAPVGRVAGGLEGLAEVIPVWESQLTVAEWDADPRSETYGQPRFYQFNESALGGTSKSPRQFRVHPDRVIIWSDDGTVNGVSALEPGYNDLLDAEKIKGAGGEGFWKTSRGAPVVGAPEGMTQADVAKAMGVSPAELVDALNDQLESFQAGFDKGLMLGGMTAVPMTISLPSPEHFFAAPVQSFAASLLMPLRVLIGNETGERASTEDAREWNKTCMARRTTRNVPLIREFVERLVRFGILPERDWTIGWADLTEATGAEKMERARGMAEINSKTPMEPVFTDDEIRETVGYDPLATRDDDGEGE